MGIDIYMEWDGITEEEGDSQITGFSTTSGHLGYLREAYHGGPYATKILVAEAFESEECVAEIPASVLRSRLPETIKAAKQRQLLIYDGRDVLDEDNPVIKSFTEFVELAEKMEKRTGKPVTIIASY